MSSCQNCFLEISEKDIFCGYCGTKIIKKEKKAIDNYEIVLNSLYGLTIALLSKLAKVDGRVCEKEAEYIKDLIIVYCEMRYTNIYSYNNDSHINYDLEVQLMKEIVKKEKYNTSNSDIEDISKRIMALNNISFENKRKIIEQMIEMSFIDGILHNEEANFILNVTKFLKIDFSIYTSLVNKYEKKYQSNSDNSSNNKSKNEEFKEKKQSNKNSFNGKLSLKESFEILELNENAINSEIKKQYRHLAKQYHYDSMVSKNLPKDLIDFAEEKLKMINAAYEVIKKNKGI